MAGYIEAKLPLEGFEQNGLIRSMQPFSFIGGPVISRSVHIAELLQTDPAQVVTEAARWLNSVEIEGKEIN